MYADEYGGYGTGMNGNYRNGGGNNGGNNNNNNNNGSSTGGGRFSGNDRGL